MVNETLVGGYHVLGDVYLPIVAHDGIEDPEEAARVGSGVGFQFSAYAADGLDARGAGHVAGQHHVEVIQVGLLEPVPEIRDLLCREFRALDSPISRVVAYAPRQARSDLRRIPTSGRGEDGLNWTVFRAAASQPSDCSTKTAILLPTWLSGGPRVSVTETERETHTPHRERTHPETTFTGELVVGRNRRWRTVSLHDWQRPGRSSLVPAVLDPSKGRKTRRVD